MSSNHVINSRAPQGAAGPLRVGGLALALVAALLAGLALTGVFSRAVSGLLHPSPVAAPVSTPYAPRRLVVSSERPLDRLLSEIRMRAGIDVRASGQSSGAPGEQILELPASVSVSRVASAVSALPGIRYAVPDYIASAAGSFIPNDPGTAGRAGGWEKLQWNFLAADGVNAPQAWGNLIRDHRAGAKGVVIAVLDSGVAYRNWQTFKRSPDFASTHFVAPCDLVAGTIRGGVCTDRFPLDRLGHGTFVAGTIAEATNNHYGLTGLAYNASIMPVRVLDSSGAGTSSTIAEGVRYAVAHGAQVINLSIEFPPGTSAGEIPDLTAAIAYAHQRGVVVVASAGNDYNDSVDFPAADPDVIAVGATTIDRCLAAYSDSGHALDLVAPGGGDDSAAIHSPNCHPNRNLPDVYQMTFADQANAADTATQVNVDAFALQSGWFGTSMAAPDVSAAAAMVIASGVLGAHPTPDAILARLEATARHLSGATPNDRYGYGLLDIGAATANGGPLTPTTPVTTTTTTVPTTTCTTTTTTPTATATTPTAAPTAAKTNTATAPTAAKTTTPRAAPTAAKTTTPTAAPTAAKTNTATTGPISTLPCATPTTTTPSTTTTTTTTTTAG
jgi:serine protease